MAAVPATRVPGLHTPAVLAAASLCTVHPDLSAVVVHRITTHQAEALTPAPAAPVPVG